MTTPDWLKPILAFAAVQTVAGVVCFAWLAASGDLRPSHTVTHAQRLLQLSVAGGTACWLLLAARDRRGIWIGAAFLLISASFAYYYFDPVQQPRLREWRFLQVLRGLPVDAFLALVVWRFVAEFPRGMTSPTSRRLVRSASYASALVGVVLITVTLVRTLLEIDFVPELARERVDSGYWLPVYGLTLFALPVGAFRVRRATPDERRRVRFLAAGLAIGGGPAVAYILLAQSQVVLQWLEARPRIMDFVQTALLTVPITTAYAVGVERALPVRTILGSAARRILGRWRELAGRDHSRDVLGRLVDRCRDAESLEQLAEVLEQGANKALHVHGIATFFRSGDCFSTPAGGLPALATSSTLVGKLRGRRTISLDGWPRLSGLSLDERHWLADVGARLLVPLGGNGDDLLGFLALAEKRSEFPFSADDRGLLADVAAAGSLVARRLLENPGSEERVEEDSVAGECTACGTVSPSAAPSCPNCGGSQEPAPLPARLSQKFELERRIGTGAVGAVYRAYDRSLERVVAIKTLPRVSPESSTNLRREAKAMASLLHPNLALIFGVETWKGVPLLVLEYLAGGTLEDRIRKGPLAPSEAVRVGTKLANALDYAHGCGTLHRDVKPSNIGFDSQDVPKLLDFGLARIMSDSRGIPRDPTTGEPLAAVDAATRASLSLTGSADSVLGTPLYLPPEALEGGEPGPSHDLWALAMVLYEAVSGRHPLERESLLETMTAISRAQVPKLSEVCPECPRELSDLLERALALEPAKRPAYARDFAAALRSVGAAKTDGRSRSA